MATETEIKAEIESLAKRVHAGQQLNARERRRFRKLAVRAGLKNDHRLVAPEHRPILKNLWRYNGVSPEMREHSQRAAKRPLGRKNRI